MTALLTDLYQLAMMQAYLDRGMEEPAVFELFVRKLPAQRNFLVAAGLEQALEFLETLAFAAPEIEWLERQGGFSARLLNIVHLQTLIASKAARIVLSAEGRQLIDFGMRRAHGAEAALSAVRSAWLAGDRAGLADEPPAGEPLLRPRMRAGRRLPGQPTLEAARRHARTQLARLPPALRALAPAAVPVAVEISQALRALASEIDAATS